MSGDLCLAMHSAIMALLAIVLGQLRASAVERRRRRAREHRHHLDAGGRAPQPASTSSTGPPAGTSPPAGLH